MSITTMLLALLPVVSRAEARKSKREAELEAEIERVLERNEQLVIERDSARRRLDQQSRMLEGMFQTRLNGQQCVCSFRDLYVAQQAQMAMQHQAQAQATQNALAYGQGQMLGAQNLSLADFWCNCVPARHDMFLRPSDGS